MNARKRGLGRGLDALLGSIPADGITDTDKVEELRTLPVDLLQRGGYQPRMDFEKDAMQELADSIKGAGSAPACHGQGPWPIPENLR